MASYTLPGRIAEGSLLSACFLVPLALGGALPATWVATCCLMTVGFVATWVYRRRTGSPLRIPWFGAVLLLVVAFTLIQAVPLPMALLRTIAPASAELLSTALAPNVPAWHAVSLDPGATLWEAMKLLSCVFAFLIAVNLGRRRARRRRIYLAITASAAVMAALAMLGAVVAPGRPLFIYTPQSGAPLQGLIAAAFVNTNHAAAFFLLGSTLGFGLTFASRGKERSWLAAAASISGVGVILTLSKGGILAFAGGLAAMWALLLWRGKVQRRSLATLVVLVGIISAVGAFAARERLVSELRIQQNAYQKEKTVLWAPGLAMVRANPWVGVGRGAFVTAFPRYLSTRVPLDRTYSHLENQYLHLPAEWGIPVGAGLIVLSVLALLGWLRRAGSSPPTIAAFAALGALGLHNIVDFNLEMLGIALPVAALAGAMAAKAATEQTQPQERPSAIPATAALSVGAALFLIAWTSTGRAPSLEQDTNRLIRLFKARASTAQLLAALDGYRQRHPADHVPHLVGAEVLARKGDGRAFRWLNRALVVNPNSPQIHLRAARLLRRTTGLGQARLEYRLALISGAPIIETLDEALELCDELKDTREVLPDSARMYVAAIDRLASAGRIALAHQLSSTGFERWPDDERMVLAHVRVTTVAEPQSAIWIARGAADRWHSPPAYRALVYALSRAPETQQIAALEEAYRRFPQDPSFALRLARVYLKNKQYKRAKKLASKVASSAGTTKTRGHAHLVLSHIFNAQGRAHRARWEAERAMRLLDPGRALRAARKPRLSLPDAAPRADASP